MLEQDLWNIGRVLGIPQFVDNNALAREMVAKIAQAHRRDLKAAREVNEMEVSDLRSTSQEQTSVLQTSISWITLLRKWCADYVIRRTVYSVDNEHKPISGVKPYKSHLLAMPLLPAERTAHEQMVAEFLENGTSESTKNRRVRTITI